MTFEGIAIRGLIAYALLLTMARVRGKRGIAEVTPFDFVLVLVIGDLVDDLIWSEVATSQFVVAAGTLFLLDLVVATMEYRSDRFYRLVNGTPRVVMVDGLPQRREMRPEQMSEEDLDHLLRKSGYRRDRYPEVKMGIFEVDSHLSVLPHAWAKPVEKPEAPKIRRMRT
jgi:uncharacterized membrane protein YcaP (DUF421 family)